MDGVGATVEVVGGVGLTVLVVALNERQTQQTSRGGQLLTDGLARHC
jgi:hypothetical protein